jgi:hypothetical protein
LVHIHITHELVQEERDYEAPEAPVINAKDWPKIMDMLHEFLARYLRETKIPLAYLVREDIDIPSDPDPATNYVTRQEVILHRAPHLNAVGEATHTYATNKQGMRIDRPNDPRQRLLDLFPASTMYTQRAHGIPCTTQSLLRT